MDNPMFFREDPELERGYIESILESNKDKNFARRILYPDNYPGLPLDPLQGEGDWGSHMMAYDTDDNGGGMVYPSIIQRKENYPLERLTLPAASKYARETGENIRFDKASDADWFGKNYKKVWR
jgi:hypothetical protein